LDVFKNAQTKASNSTLGLPISEPPKQNCTDHDDIQNN
jgi:hypothetical protein